MSRINMGFVYGLAALLGALTLLLPSPSVVGVIGITITAAYGVASIIGGLAGIVGVSMPNFNIELVGLWLVTVGYLSYGVALIGIFISRINQPVEFPPAYGPPIAVAALSIFLIVQLVRLIRKSRRVNGNSVTSNGLG